MTDIVTLLARHGLSGKLRDAAYLEAAWRTV
jgi:hypothetical protein